MINYKDIGEFPLCFPRDFTTKDILNEDEVRLISNLNRESFKDFVEREEFVSRKPFSFQDKYKKSCENCGQERLFFNYYKCPNCGKSNPHYINFNYG